MSIRMHQMIREYIEKRGAARLEKLDKELAKNNSENNSEKEADYLKRREEEEEKYKPNVWLTSAAKRANQIKMATHALKFTHPRAEGTSVYVKSCYEISDFSVKYVSTSSLKRLIIDVVGNAAALDVASLLQLEVDGVSLMNSIVQGDISALSTFSETDEQLSDWLNGFKETLADKELSSHKLAKQLYFPVSKNRYHIISPLYASSLSQAVYQRIADSRFTDVAKEARKAKKEDKFHESVIFDYPKTAVQTFGGTQPQNISQLNSSRGGRSYLFNCQPPLWKSVARPPAKHKNSFWKEFERRGGWRITKALKAYLIEGLEKPSTQLRRSTRAEMIDELISLLLNYAAEIQGLTEQAGWSAESNLPISEQLWLDPFRMDPDFQQLRAANDWQEEIARQFSSWLNHKINDEKIVFKDAEHSEWKKLCEVRLSQLKEDLEVLTT